MVREFSPRPQNHFVEDFTQLRGQALNTIMKTLFTAEAISKGGRSGFIQAPNWLLNIPLGNPLDPSAEQRGPNPELLFACAYSATAGSIRI